MQRNFNVIVINHYLLKMGEHLTVVECSDIETGIQYYGNLKIFGKQNESNN